MPLPLLAGHSRVDHGYIMASMRDTLLVTTKEARPILSDRAGWLAVIYAVGLVTFGVLSRPPIPASAHGVWPADWRAAICEGYRLSETHDLSLPANAAKVTAMLDAATGYPEGRELMARLRELLTLYRTAGVGDRATANEAMGAAYDARYRFYDAMTVMWRTHGEHCL